MPSRGRAFDILGYALSAAFGPTSPEEGLSPHHGHSPSSNLAALAGHSHRLTSGGKADDQSQPY